MPKPAPARLVLPEIAPIARTSRECFLLQDSLCLEAERLIRAQPPGVRAAFRPHTGQAARTWHRDLAFSIGARMNHANIGVRNTAYDGQA